MLLYNLLTQRRTIHQYQAHPIPEELVLKAIEVAVHAPNHNHTQPWRFTIVGHQARTKLAELAKQIKLKPEEYSSAKEKAIKDKILNPSHLIAISQVKSPNPLQSQEDYGAIACAIQNMSLFLWPKSIGTKWSTGKITRHNETYEILSISPQKENIIGFFWIGYPLYVPQKPPKSKIQEVIRRTK